MADVFLSYSRIDRPSAKLIAEGLEAEGISVWWDPDLQPGEVFDSEIERQIEAARCVIVVWSQNSISSKWVRSEASVGDERRILIPVIIEQVRLPIAFKLIQTEDLSQWAGEREAESWQRVVLQVRALLGMPDDTTRPGGMDEPDKTTARTGVVMRSSVAPVAVLTVSGLAYTIWEQSTASSSLAVALGLALLAFLFFRFAEYDLSPHMKALAERWLLPRIGQFKVDTPEALNHLFEAIFGRRHFTTECFVKSTLLSAAFFTIIIFLASLLFLDQIDWRPSSLIVIFFFGFFVNALGDYVALLKTRLLLRAYKAGWSILPIILVDVVGILAIFAAATTVAVILIYGIYQVTGAHRFSGWQDYFDAVRTAVNEVLQQPLMEVPGYDPGVKRYALPEKILLYSAFLTMSMTSLWLWIALLLSPIIRVLVWSSSTGLTVVGFIFDVHNAPFAAMGYLSAFVILLLGTLQWGVSKVVAAIASSAFG
jgi:hypothetical protein